MINSNLISEAHVNKVGNRFFLVLIASKRVYELRKGKKPLIDVIPGMTHVSIALEEILQGKIGPLTYILK